MVMRDVFPELFTRYKVSSIHQYANKLYHCMEECIPKRTENPHMVVLTPGIYNSAYFEHSFLAEQMGIALVEGKDLFVENDTVYMKTVKGKLKVDCIYRRLDDNFLDPKVFYKESLIGVPGLFKCWKKGNVGIVNGIGTGIADDKAIYSYVNKMIVYYLGEQPKINQVETFLCHEKKDRDFVIDFCSIKSVCSKFEKIIDNLDPTDWDFDFAYVKKDASYNPPNIESDEDWIIDLYTNILKVPDVNKTDRSGVDHWMQRLSNDLNRDQVLEYFRNVAHKDNQENTKIPFEDILGKDDNGKRILFAVPENENDIFLSTSLLKSIKDKHPDCNIYFATKPDFFDMLHGNPYIYKTIEYNPIMENSSWTTGQGSHKGYFKFALLPYFNTHKADNFSHADRNPLNYNLEHA